MKWFLFNGKEKIGPFSVNELEKLMAEGKIIASALVAREGSPVKRIFHSDPLLSHLVRPPEPHPTGTLISSLEVDVPEPPEPIQFQDWSRLSIDLDFANKPVAKENDAGILSDISRGEPRLSHDDDEGTSATQLVDPEVVKRRSQQAPVSPLPATSLAEKKPVTPVAAQVPVHQQPQAMSEAHFSLAPPEGMSSPQWDRLNSTSLRRGVAPPSASGSVGGGRGQPGGTAGAWRSPRAFGGSSERTSTVARRAKAGLTQGLWAGLVSSIVILVCYFVYQRVKFVPKEEKIVPQALVSQYASPQEIQHVSRAVDDTQEVTKKPQPKKNPPPLKNSRQSDLKMRSATKPSHVKNKSFSGGAPQAGQPRSQEDAEVARSSTPRSRPVTKPDSAPSGALPRHWRGAAVQSGPVLRALKLKMVQIDGLRVGIVPLGCQPCRVPAKLPDGTAVILVSANRTVWQNIEVSRVAVRGLMQKEEAGTLWVLVQEVVPR